MKVKSCSTIGPSNVPPVVKMEIALPGHLAWWLEQFAKQLAMKPSQLLAIILEHYYETWRLGYEMGCEKACTDGE